MSYTKRYIDELLAQGIDVFGENDIHDDYEYEIYVKQYNDNLIRRQDEEVTLNSTNEGD